MSIVLPWHRFTASTWNTPGLYRGEQRRISFTRLLRKECHNSTCYHIKKLEKERTWNIAIDTREEKREEKKSIVVTCKFAQRQGLSGGFLGKINKGHKLLNLIPWHKKDTKGNWQRTKKGERENKGFFLFSSVCGLSDTTHLAEQFNWMKSSLLLSNHIITLKFDLFTSTRTSR